MKADILQRFTARWFLCKDSDEAAAAVAEMCCVCDVLLADRGGALLPLNHDEPIITLLTAILRGSEDLRAAAGRKSGGTNLAPVREVSTASLHLARVVVSKPTVYWSTLYSVII